MTLKTDENDVKEANKAFFNATADIYESVDGRRSKGQLDFLDQQLHHLAQRTRGDSILDIGAGTGIVLRYAKKHFRHLFAVDISWKIVARCPADIAGRCCADATNLPFSNNSFDAVTFFAVLHHCLDIRPILTEALRVLKPGGFLYTDHDLDDAFMKRWPTAMKIYRTFFNAEHKYLKACTDITPTMYHLSEIHDDGIDSGSLSDWLSQAGAAKTEIRRHWRGLSPIINRSPLASKDNFPIGLAPLVQVVAQKTG